MSKKQYIDVIRCPFCDAEEATLRRGADDQDPVYDFSIPQMHRMRWYKCKGPLEHRFGTVEKYLFQLGPRKGYRHGDLVQKREGQEMAFDVGRIADGVLKADRNIGKEVCEQIAYLAVSHLYSIEPAKRRTWRPDYKSTRTIINEIYSYRQVGDATLRAIANIDPDSERYYGAFLRFYVEHNKLHQSGRGMVAKVDAAWTSMRTEGIGDMP